MIRAYDNPKNQFEKEMNLKSVDKRGNVIRSGYGPLRSEETSINRNCYREFHSLFPFLFISGGK